MPAVELTPEAAYYVIGFYGSLMTDVERRAQQHLSATMKATLGRSDVAAQKDTQRSRIRSKFLSEEPNVLRLAADGYEAFAQRTAARILRECGAEVPFNRCPRCGELARTPTAKQSRNCHHDCHAAGF